LKIIITLVIAQAAWDSQLLMEYPDWFVHNADGAIVAPNTESNDVALIDFNQHELRKYMMAMMKFWVREIGVDGFRCRSSDMIPTDFWEIARSELDKIKPVLLISESMIPEHHLKAFDFTCSWNMDTTIMKILNGTAPASAINDSLSAEYNQFPKGSLQLRFTVQDNLTNDNPFPQKARVGFILAFTLPGVPLLYSGNKTIDKREIFDKFDESIIALRRGHPALQGGSYRNLPNSKSSYLYSFLRFSGNDTVFTIVNFANREKDAEIQMPEGTSLIWKDQFSDVRMEVENSRLRTAIPPLGFLIMVPSPKKELK
jgi:glycosidase